MIKLLNGSSICFEYLDKKYIHFYLPYAETVEEIQEYLTWASKNKKAYAMPLFMKLTNEFPTLEPIAEHGQFKIRSTISNDDMVTIHIFNETSKMWENNFHGHYDDFMNLKSEDLIN